MTPAELNWMERAAPLLGATPRAVKRFANVYLLMRSVGRGRGWTAPGEGQLVVLLALATGAPELAEGVLTYIEQAAFTPCLLKNAPASTDPSASDNHPSVLQDAIGADPGLGNLDMAGLQNWIDLIRRFRFHR